jgi:hypothetical protein
LRFQLKDGAGTGAAKHEERSTTFGFVDEDIKPVRAAPSIFDLIALRVYNTVAERKFDLGSRVLVATFG